MDDSTKTDRLSIATDFVGPVHGWMTVTVEDRDCQKGDCIRDYSSIECEESLKFKSLAIWFAWYATNLKWEWITL